MRRLGLLTALLLGTAGAASAKDSSCSKWGPGEENELQKCVATQEVAIKLMWAWLTKYGVSSSTQLNAAAQEERLFASLFAECLKGDVVAEFWDLTETVACLERRESLEKAAGYDLRKSGKE
jgi:hypothetical protein